MSLQREAGGLLKKCKQSQLRKVQRGKHKGKTVRKEGAARCLTPKQHHAAAVKYAKALAAKHRADNRAKARAARKRKSTKKGGEAPMDTVEPMIGGYAEPMQPMMMDPRYGGFAPAPMMYEPRYAGAAYGVPDAYAAYDPRYGGFDYAPAPQSVPRYAGYAYAPEVDQFDQDMGRYGGMAFAPSAEFDFDSSSVGGDGEDRTGGAKKKRRRRHRRGGDDALLGGVGEEVRTGGKKKGKRRHLTHPKRKAHPKAHGGIVHVKGSTYKVKKGKAKGTVVHRRPSIRHV